MPENNTMFDIMELPQYQLSEVNEAANLIRNAKIVGECYRVRVLFDTEHLKSDKDYIAIIEDTWLRAFKDTDPELLEEAVHEFVMSDKKGYLPKPGQIVELLVKGVKAIESRNYWQKFERMERERLYAKYQDDE